MTAYYNEIDPKAAAWLRELIKAGAIAPGDVDERDIRDVRPSELDGFTQCHFFAGIGVWSYALRLAGWSDSEPVWTGSCPCQPFSAAGKGGGFDDERHLWPAWFHLIEEHGPSVIFGEQVANKSADLWIDLVQTDLEALDYAVGATPFPAAGIGAPHVRDRLYFVANSGRERFQGQRLQLLSGRPLETMLEAGRDSEVGELDLAAGGGRQWLGNQSAHFQLVQASQASVELADNAQQRCREGSQDLGGLTEGDRAKRLPSGSVPSGHVNGFWRDAEWIYCRDEKYRPVEPGSFPLAHGAPERVGRLRGYGNGLVAHQAAAFIEAYLQC